MSTTPTYHQRVAAEKRVVILQAAAALFGSQGYAGTSLAQIADGAGVSKATLFKQFPTKSDLFDAIVDDAWSTDATPSEQPDPADPAAALSLLGTTYAELIGRPGMAGLFRLVIAEAPAFPDLARRQFDLGKEPFFDRVRTFLEQAHAAGTLSVDDATIAATQFLGMISNYVLWPRLLLVEWEPAADEVDRVVAEAVRTCLARYGS